MNACEQIYQILNSIPMLFSHNFQSFSPFYSVTTEFFEFFLQSAQYSPLSTSSLSRQNIEVWLPWRGLFVKNMKKGQTMFTITPTTPFVNSLTSSVLTTPGCKQAVIPFFGSILAASEVVKRVTQTFDKEQAWFRSQGVEAQLMSQRLNLGLAKKARRFLWAMEERLMTLKKVELLIFSQRRWVRQKWPKQLTAQCISLPSLVSLFSGMDMIPALLTRQSMWGKETAWANDSTDYLTARSKWIQSMFLLLVSLMISFTVFSDLRRSLAPKMMLQPSLASSLRVSLPMPVLAPVMTTFFPDKFKPLGMRKTPPLKYCLRRQRERRRRAESARVCQREEGRREANIQILQVLYDLALSNQTSALYC